MAFSHPDQTAESFTGKEQMAVQCAAEPLARASGLYRFLRTAWLLMRAVFSRSQPGSQAAFFG